MNATRAPETPIFLKCSMHILKSFQPIQGSPKPLNLLILSMLVGSNRGHHDRSY
jgi:hypothetical protein